MAESIRKLEDQLRDKQRELDATGSKLAGATIGTAITRGLAIGAAAGALMGREKNKKAALEREIQTLERKLQESQRRLSELKTQHTRLQNDFQNQKVRLEADARTQRAAIERKKQDTQDPDTIRAVDTELSRFQADTTERERTNQREYEKQLNTLQQEINRLSL